MRIITIGICSLTLLFSCAESKNNEDKSETIIAETNVESPEQNIGLRIDKTAFEYTAKTIFTPDHGWGYQILNLGELYINQPHIPSIPGNSGFDSEEKAQKTADFVIYKLNNGIVPPTVSPEELDSLGVM